MPHKAFSETWLQLDHAPEKSELTSLLKGRVARRLRCWGDGRYIEITPAPVPVWLLLPSLVGFGLLVLIAPFAMQLWEGEFMGWWRWLTLAAFTWLVVLPCLLLLFSYLVQRGCSKGAIAVIDTEARELHIPSCDRPLAGEDICQFVELFRWSLHEKKWCSVLQLNVVVQGPNGGFEVYPIVTQHHVPRPPDAVTSHLTRVFPAPLLSIRLDLAESQALGDR